jgi:hypothetical protein
MSALVKSLSVLLPSPMSACAPPCTCPRPLHGLPRPRGPPSAPQQTPPRLQLTRPAPGPQTEFLAHLHALGPDGDAAAAMGAAVAAEIHPGHPDGPPGRPGQPAEEAEAELGGMLLDLEAALARLFCPLRPVVGPPAPMDPLPPGGGGGGGGDCTGLRAVAPVRFLLP